MVHKPVSMYMLRKPTDGHQVSHPSHGPCCQDSKCGAISAGYIRRSLLRGNGMKSDHGAHASAISLLTIISRPAKPARSCLQEDGPEESVEIHNGTSEAGAASCGASSFGAMLIRSWQGRILPSHHQEVPCPNRGLSLAKFGSIHVRKEQGPETVLEGGDPGSVRLHPPLICQLASLEHPGNWRSSSKFLEISFGHGR